MKRTVIVSMVFLTALFLCQTAAAQNYIGLHKEDIAKAMKADHKQFKLNRSTVNPHYNYLKYEDSINEITILFFLSDEDVCTLVRKICDYSNINEIIQELNSLYTAKEQNVWIEKKDGKIYLIELTEEEWFFTVTTKPEKQD